MIKVFKYRNEIPKDFIGKCIIVQSQQCIRNLNGILWFNGVPKYNQKVQFNCEYSNGLLHKHD